MLQAFLSVSRYRHGARSMESIVGVSSLSGKRCFDPSSLPQLNQLDMHVPAWEFVAWVQFRTLLKSREESLAEAFHDCYCKSLLGRGYHYGPEDDEGKMTKKCLVPFDQLEPSYKGDNRRAVRDVPDKLAAAGYAAIPLPDGSSPDLPDEMLEHLAELEHDGWLRSKIACAWSYAPVRNEELRQHPAMLPWKPLTVEERAVRYPENPEAVGLEELPENEKRKDRDQIQGMMGVLRKLRYELIQVGG